MATSNWGAELYMSKLKQGVKFLNEAIQSVTCRSTNFADL